MKRRGSTDSLSGRNKGKKKGAIEIAEKLYLNCTYETFQSAKSAAEEYDKNLVELKSAHEMILRSAAYLRERKVHLEDLDLDMDQIRYDIRETEKQISSKQEERTSILEQLALTDYEAVKDRLDACISWLNAFPKEFQKRVPKRHKRRMKQTDRSEPYQQCGYDKGI